MFVAYFSALIIDESLSGWEDNVVVNVSGNAVIDRPSCNWDGVFW
jgi:hypothetical protein